jgi:hypothetical protein
MRITIDGIKYDIRFARWYKGKPTEINLRLFNLDNYSDGLLTTNFHHGLVNKKDKYFYIRCALDFKIFTAREIDKTELQNIFNQNSKLHIYKHSKKFNGGMKK